MPTPSECKSDDEWDMCSLSSSHASNSSWCDIAMEFNPMNNCEFKAYEVMLRDPNGAPDECFHPSDVFGIGPRPASHPQITEPRNEPKKKKNTNTLITIEEEVEDGVGETIKDWAESRRSRKFSLVSLKCGSGSGNSFWYLRKVCPSLTIQKTAGKGYFFAVPGGGLPITNLEPQHCLKFNNSPPEDIYRRYSVELSLDKRKLWDVVPEALSTETKIQEENFKGRKSREQRSRERSITFGLLEDALVQNFTPQLKRSKMDREIDAYLDNQIIKDARYYKLKGVKSRYKSDPETTPESEAIAEAQNEPLTHRQVVDLCAKFPANVVAANEARMAKRVKHLELIERKATRKRGAVSEPTEEEKENDAPLARLRVQTMKGRTCYSGFRVNSAVISNSGHNSAWAPRTFADNRDFLQIDLGSIQRVHFIGTKGRALKRKGVKGALHRLVVDPNTPREWVTRYKLSYKLEEGGGWVHVGNFDGNTDAETEVAHQLINQHTDQRGLRARFFRIQPLSYRGRKSIRVGFYGVAKKANSPKKGTKRKGKKGGAELTLDDAAVCLTVTNKKVLGKMNFCLYSTRSCCTYDRKEQKHKAQVALNNEIKNGLDFYTSRKLSFGDDFGDFWPEVSITTRRSKCSWW